MTALLALIAVLLLVVALFNFTELAASAKIGLTVVLFGLVGAGIAYEQQMSEAREHVQSVALKYQQHRPITCDGIDVDVNQSTFSFSEGTYSFIGRTGTPFEGLLLSLEQCR